MAKINTVSCQQDVGVVDSKVVQGVLRNDKDLSAYLGGASSELLLLLRTLGLPFHKFGKTRFYFPNEIDEWIRTNGECNSVNESQFDEDDCEVDIENRTADTIKEEKHININYGKRY